MSDNGNNSQRIIPTGMLLSKEEAELKRKIDGAYFMMNFLPLWLVSTLALKYSLNKGRIKTQRPGLYYVGVGMTTYIFSKFMAFQEIKRQMKEKFPDGIFNQTSNMNKDQLIEFLNKKELEVAKAKLEAAGMNVTENPGQAALEETSGEAINKSPASQSDEPQVRRTYADLRKQQSSGVSTQNTPLQPNKNTELQSDDPPSKLNGLTFEIDLLSNSNALRAKSVSKRKEADSEEY